MSEKPSQAEPSLAIVTGASHRLGRAFTQALARRGYAIGLHYFQSKTEAEQLADELDRQGVPVILLQADLREPAQLDRLIRQITGSGYTPRVLINSAAEMVRKPITEITVQEWDDSFALNLRAAWYLSVQLAPLMTDGGIIINISDVGAIRAWSGFGAYSITKAGLNSLTQLLARALAPGIRVCAIAPGLVLPPEGLSKDKWERLLAKTPQKKAVNLSSLTSAMEFLLDNEYITGDILTIDGGRQLV